MVGFAWFTFEVSLNFGEIKLPLIQLSIVAEGLKILL